MEWFATKYRVNRDWCFSTQFWAVEQKKWWFPVWTEVRGLLRSKEDAIELMNLLKATQ